MLEWLISRGWTLELTPGSCVVHRGDYMGAFSCVEEAYYALGGPHP